MSLANGGGSFGRTSGEGGEKIRLKQGKRESQKEATLWYDDEMERGKRGAGQMRGGGVQETNYLGKGEPFQGLTNVEGGGQGKTRSQMQVGRKDRKTKVNPGYVQASFLIHRGRESRDAPRSGPERSTQRKEWKRDGVGGKRP